MKITKKVKTHFEEVRHFDGHSTEGTGTYRQKEYVVYCVNRKEFNSIMAAKRYIKGLKNKTKVKELKKKYAALLKKSKQISKLQSKVLQQLINYGAY